MKKLLLVLLALWASAVLAQGNSSSGGITGNVQGSAPSLNATNQLTAYKINGTTFGWSATDPGGGFSIFYGQGAGLNAGIAGATKGFFTCIGYNTCGGAGPGNVNNGVNIENTAVGWAAGSLLTTGTFNNYFGTGAGRNETTGSQNVCVGTDCMGQTAGSNQSTGVGVGTLKWGAPNSDVGVGFSVMTGTSTVAPVRDTAVGSLSLNAAGLVSPADLTMIGYKTGFALTTGNSMTVIGSSAGSVNCGATSGSNVIIISSGASVIDCPSATTSNYLSINDKINGSLATLGSGNLSTCGTTPSVATGSNDMAGSITTGTGATACTLQTNLAKSAPALCIIVAVDGGTPPTYTTDDNGSNSHINLTTARATTTYNYWCPRH